MGSGSTANIKGLYRAMEAGIISPACQKVLLLCWPGVWPLSSVSSLACCALRPTGDGAWQSRSTSMYLATSHCRRLLFRCRACRYAHIRAGLDIPATVYIHFFRGLPLILVIFQNTSLAYVIGLREFLRRVNLVDAREALIRMTILCEDPARMGFRDKP